MKSKLSFALVIILFFLAPSCSNAQFLKKVSKALNTTTSTGFSEDEAASAIKEALVKGTGESVTIVSVVDGYFKNPEIKIPFPPEATAMESKLRSAGLGNQVDKAVLSINRAAENAAKDAQPIFVSAVKGMSIKDAINIVRGKDNAATEYLKNSTSPALKTQFKPAIQKSLDEVNATKYWTDLINTYNKIPFVQKMNPDLASYVTDRAVEGLFVMIAKEELKIRKDPVARTTDLLKKVFGNL
ncbi:MAG TPA: DUF4197 domain-containing protein [Bacteroidales bacterium]|nr:DUF4197 domain-containing protein [Bacteroidales bacterium]